MRYLQTTDRWEAVIRDTIRTLLMTRPPSAVQPVRVEMEGKTMRSRMKMTHVEKVRRPATLATGFWRTFGILCLLLAATGIASPAQDEQPSTDPVTFTTL